MKKRRKEICDDLGVRWSYRGGKIRAVEDHSKGGGYWCDSFEDGIRLLKEDGYITSPPKQGKP